jgi:hypothetical protein
MRRRLLRPAVRCLRCLLPRCAHPPPIAPAPPLIAPPLRVCERLCGRQKTGIFFIFITFLLNVYRRPTPFFKKRPSKER